MTGPGPDHDPSLGGQETIETWIANGEASGLPWTPDEVHELLSWIEAPEVRKA